MNKPQLTISNESSTLLEPNLHDGRLLGIVLTSPGRVELTASDLNGKSYRISLSGVSQFRATDFRAGNIILDVTVAQGDDVQMAELQPLVQANENTEQFATELKTIYDAVVRESLYVFELNPSYGCHLIAVAKGINVSSAT